MVGMRRRPKNKNARWRGIHQSVLNGQEYIKHMKRDVPPLMLNTFGMVINAIHTGEIGRGGYFPETSGTSEAQFITVKSCALAYAITNNPEFKEQAEKLAAAALHVMYRYNGTSRTPMVDPNMTPGPARDENWNAAIPPIDASDSVARRWMPHWLFNVGEAFTAKGPARDRSGALTPQSDGWLMQSVTLNADGYGKVNHDPDKLAQVYKAYHPKSRLLWQNCVSSIFPPPIGQPEAKEYEIDFFFTANGYLGVPDAVEPIKANYSSRVLTDADFPNGSVEVSITDASGVTTVRTVNWSLPSSVNSLAAAKGWFKVKQNDQWGKEVKINYSTFTGKLILTNMPFDAWPMWRDIYDQETLSAYDSLFWAYDAYKTMWQQFEGGVEPASTAQANSPAFKWYRAMIHTMRNVERYGTLIGSDRLWGKNPDVGNDPKAETGNDYYSVPDVEFFKPMTPTSTDNYEGQPGPQPTWGRDSEGYLQAVLTQDYTVPPENYQGLPWKGAPSSSFHHYAYAANTIYYKTRPEATSTVRAWSSKTQTLVFEFRAAKDYDEDVLYFKDIHVEANKWRTVTIPVRDFTKHEDAIWRPGVSCKVIKAPENTSINDYKFAELPLNATLAGEMGVSKGRCLHVQGAMTPSDFCEVMFFPNPTDWPAFTKKPTIYVYRAPGSAPMYVVQGGVTLMEVPATGFIERIDLEALFPTLAGSPGPVTFKYQDPYVGTETPRPDIDFAVWRIEKNEADWIRWPEGGEIWVAGIKSYLWEAHTLKLGDTTVSGYANKKLAYNPGVTPFTVDLVNGTLKQWRGSPYVGYQGGEPWVDIAARTADPDERKKYIDCIVTLCRFYKAAQDHYRDTSGDAQGPFTPVFLWPSWEDIRSESPSGEFSWTGADPNTGWGGYMARAYYELAKMLYFAKKAGLWGHLPSYAPSVLMDALRHWRNFMVSHNNRPISTFFHSKTKAANGTYNVSPTDDYDEPHAMSLVVRAAMYANLTLGESLGPQDAQMLAYIITRGVDYIFSRYQRSPFLVPGKDDVPRDCVQGSFAYVYPPSDVNRNKDGFSYYGFHHAEITQTMALLALHMHELNLTGVGTGEDLPVDPPTGEAGPIDAELATIFEDMLNYIGRWQKPSGPLNTHVYMLINSSNGLTSANMHTGPNAVGAHETTGTSEGQFIMAKGLLYAYLASEFETYLQKADWLLNAAVNYIFPGGVDPATETSWCVPHWLFVTKYPVSVEGNSQGKFVYPQDWVDPSKAGQPVAVKIGDRVNTGNTIMNADQYNCAFDSIQWAVEAYWLMYVATNNVRYRKIARAIAHTGWIASQDWGSEPLPATAGGQYMPGLQPFTLNSKGTQMNGDWRGPFYSGYQTFLPAILKGSQMGINNVAKFLLDAQDAYTAARPGVVGPFAPVYHHGRSDDTWGASGTWNWSGPDGNTHWGGFQYRAFEEAAKGWRWIIDNGMAVPSSLKTVVNRFIDFLHAEVTANNTCPSSFPSGANPSGYDSDPHNVALALRGAIFARTVLESAAMRSKAQFIISKLYVALKSKRITAENDMKGSFSTDVGNKRDFTFHIGEVLGALGAARYYGVSLTDDGVIDETAPTLFSTTPAPDAIGVVPTDNIVFTFSETVVRGLGSFTLKRKTDGTTVEVMDVQGPKVSVSGANVTVNPDTTLAYLTEYTMEAPAGIVVDRSGNALATPISLSFKTGAKPPGQENRIWAFFGGDQMAQWFQPDTTHGGVAPAIHFLDIYAGDGSPVVAAGIPRERFQAFNGVVPGSVSEPQTGRTAYWFDPETVAPSAACLDKINELKALLGDDTVLDGVILTLHEHIAMDFYNHLGGQNPYVASGPATAFANRHRDAMSGFAAWLRGPNGFNKPTLRIGVQVIPPIFTGTNPNQRNQDMETYISYIQRAHGQEWGDVQVGITRIGGHINDTPPPGVTELLPPQMFWGASENFGYDFRNAYPDYS